MKRSELKDPRNWWQKFVDQTYGAPEYTFYLTKEQLISTLNGLNSIEDKDRRIAETTRKVERALQCPKNINGNEVYTLFRIDTSELYIVRNFTEVTKEMLFSTVTSNGFVSYTEFH